MLVTIRSPIAMVARVRGKSGAMDSEESLPFARDVEMRFCAVEPRPASSRRTHPE
jgi:hypothetical protein